MNFKQPLYSIGQTVTHRKNLYGETEGKIAEIRRCFSEIDKAGNFVYRGVSILEIPEMTFNGTHSIVDDTLTINLRDGSVSQYKFSGYNYTVETSKMRTTFGEKNIKIKK